MTELCSQELLARFAFWRVLGVGPSLIAECLREFGSINTLFEQKNCLPETLKTLLQAADWKGAEKDLAWLSQANHHLIILGAKKFPKPLAEITQVPPWLFVKGNPNILSQPQIAIVGSRNPTYYGIKAAQQLTCELAQAGLIITSGLALGIDSICHQAALTIQKQTIGVLAVGLDRVYPKRHQKLADEILEKGGALVSEFSIGMQALPENFPRRNRIISGLSLGVLVIEATLKSGSLITARYGAEQGREVFAVPGSIFQPLAQGCHRLIQEGAKCVQNTQDILEELSYKIQPIEKTFVDVQNNKQEINLSDQERTLLKSLSEIPQTFEILSGQLSWSMQMLQMTLTQLMLKGLVQHSWHGYYRF